MRQWQRHLWLFGVLVWAGESQANEAIEWLERMGKAVRDLNYRGVFVYQHGAQLESMQLLHGVTGGREVERLSALNGLPREVVRDNNSTLCVLPDKRSVSVAWRSADRGFRGVLSGSPEALMPYYEFTRAGSDRVAGRATEVVQITPRDGFRYGHRLYLDREHALPLKSEMLDAGVPVSQILFTSLEVLPELQLEWQPEGEAKGDQYLWTQQEPPQEMPQGDETHGWRFLGLPEGFKLSVHARRGRSGGGAPVDHFVFSDGLATLSVYIEPTDRPDALQGGSRAGAAHLFGRRSGNRQITVVGEVPEATVRKVAESAQRVGGKGDD